MQIAYRDPFIQLLCDDVGRLVSKESVDRSSVEMRLRELATANSLQTAEYWKRTSPGFGVPDHAYKSCPPYFFPEERPVETFRTSGTVGQNTGTVAYTARGLELMNLSILANARRHIVADLSEPVIIRLVPSRRAAPTMVMAYGMELIAEELGNQALSTCVLTSDGFDRRLLQTRLDAAIVEQRPVVLIGGTLGIVNLCDALGRDGLSWELPAGSRIVDAGGFKGRSKAVPVDAMRAQAKRIFDVDPHRCINLFGMTELASQLYDSTDIAVGPLEERPKKSESFVRLQVRDPQDLSLREQGRGMLEIVDLCILDRPYAVLAGDWGIASPAGIAVAGRIERGHSRGCSLTLDDITTPASRK